ncbi:MAG: hypothetical protein AAF713_01390 [Pseudomonadota bacterium]
MRSTRPMLRIAAVGLCLAGCGAIKATFPNTYAGYEAGGVLGALDGMTGSILARCQAVDGTEIRVAIDGVALAAGQEDPVERIRAARMRACQTAGAVHVLVDALDGAVERRRVVPFDRAGAAAKHGIR